MSLAEDLRVGWCPGALRPMAVGDGLLVRVKPRGNRLTLAQARLVAEVATRFGNGILNLTGRANVQIRGVAQGDLPALTEALGSAGLLDPSPEGEAARNVLCSPLAGIDPEAVLDIRPLVGALEEALVDDPRFQSLPAKFNWSVDDGGVLGLDGVPSDVRFVATHAPGRPRLLVGLAGDEAAAICTPEAISAVAAALAEAALELWAERRLTPHRMADLTSACGAPAIFARAGLPVVPTRRPDRPQTSPVGNRSVGARNVLGVAPAFGRLEAGALKTFASAAQEAGASDLRLTPWRSLLAVDLCPAAAAPLLAGATAAGLITDAADPRLALAVCTGAPACRRAGAPVQSHAADWAKLLGPRGRPSTLLHVSGCPKGCARAAPAPLTLVARDGSYDLVRNGRAGDPPAVAGLSAGAVAAMLAGNDPALGEARS